ncbi:acyl-CoA thioester hydrolase [Flavobacteriaceae bacterium MAR_2010_188]|nr:acyl-CoA thioester hydrolase [Flavobacteriaceae bacterium MAR_2010_188]
MKKKLNNNGSVLNHTEIIRVNFFDADPLGIVWHGNYIKYFEIAREAFGRKFSLTYLDVKKHGFATPIVETSSSHKLPLKYGHNAKVEISFINNEAAKLTFRYKIYDDNQNLVCTGETVQVFTDFETGELSLSNPKFFLNWKKLHII